MRIFSQHNVYCGLQLNGQLQLKIHRYIVMVNKTAPKYRWTFRATRSPRVADGSLCRLPASEWHKSARYVRASPCSALNVSRHNLNWTRCGTGSQWSLPMRPWSGPWNRLLLFWPRRKGYARQRRHSKMAFDRHIGFYRTGNSAMACDPPTPKTIT